MIVRSTGRRVLRWGWLLLLATWGVVSPLSAAQRPESAKIGLPELGARAQCWGVGRVAALETRRVDTGGVLTTVTLDSVQWWRRGEAGATVQFVVFGGRLGEIESRPTRARRWRLNDWVLVGLRRNQEGVWIPAMGDDSIFSVVDHRPEIGKGLVVSVPGRFRTNLRPLATLAAWRDALSIQ